MKTLNIFFASVLAQDGPGVDSSRKMSFDQKVENARTKCQYYMNKAMVCDRPASKISKYTHRFEKVCFKPVLFFFTLIFLSYA